MAELIVCDTEGSKARRAQRHVLSKLPLSPPAAPERPRIRFVVGKRAHIERFVLACQRFREDCGNVSLEEQWRSAHELFERYLMRGSSKLVGDQVKNGTSISEVMAEVTAARESLNFAIADGLSNPAYSPLGLFESFYDDAAMNLGLSPSS